MKMCALHNTLGTIQFWLWKREQMAFSSLRKSEAFLTHWLGPPVLSRVCSKGTVQRGTATLEELREEAVTVPAGVRIVVSNVAPWFFLQASGCM